MKWAWALILVGCGGSPTPYGRLTRFEAPKTGAEARGYGCDLVGPDDGAGFEAYATIAPGAIVLVEARGLRHDETGPVELRIGTGSIGPDGEPLFDEEAPLLDRAAVLPRADHYLDFEIDPLSLWPLSLDGGPPQRPALRLGRFVGELYAEHDGLYATGAIFTGYRSDPSLAAPSVRVEGEMAVSCAGVGCNAQPVCVRADIDPLDPRVP